MSDYRVAVSDGGYDLEVTENTTQIIRVNQGTRGPQGDPGSGFIVRGTRAAPEEITASGGINGANSAIGEMQFVVGSPGAVTLSANPQISLPPSIAKQLMLVGTSNTNTVTLSNGNGLELNGPCVLKNGSRIHLQYDGTVWGEVSRNDI